MSRSALRRLWAALAQKYYRRDAVRRLPELDDHLLRDIGIDRSEIRRVVDGLSASAAPPPDDRTVQLQVLLLRPVIGGRAPR